VRFSKINVAQPGAASSPRDPSEAVEIEVLGPLPAEDARLADCGVTRFSPYNANDDRGGCGPAAGYYAEVAVGDLVIPPSRRLVLGLPGSAVFPWPSASGQPFSILHDGPDYLALRGPEGELRAAVAYPSPDGPSILPGCALFSGIAEAIPADEPTATDPPRDQALVRCGGGDWQLIPLAEVAWGRPTRCPARGAADASPPEPAGEAGAAGSGGGGAGGGAAGRGGAVAVTELDPGLEPTCGCRLAGPGARGDRGAVGLLLALAGLAGFARRRASSFPLEGAGGQNARHGAPRDRSRHHRHDGPPA
jgi:hypothetical protein